MSKRKAIDEAPAHIVEWVAANPLAAAEAFVDRVRQDAFADVAMGRPIEDAIALGRDARRQEGTQKSRRAEIDGWIRKQLTSDPSLKSPELWLRAPQVITDQISIDAFKKRVTGVRKKRR